MIKKYIRKLFNILTSPFRLLWWLFKLLIKGIRNLTSYLVFLITEEEEDIPLEETLSKTVNNPVGLLDHIDALRKHLLRALIVLSLMIGLSVTYTSKIIDIMAKPIGGIQALVAIDVTEPLGVFMKVALLTGFALAIPYIVFEFWLFFAPGLRLKTRLISLISIPIATLLFFGGMAFAYYVLLPVGIPWLINFLGIPTELRPSNYIQFVTSVMFWIGISFEFPLLIYFLAMMGVVKGKFLAEQWRIAVVIIAIIAAAITPTIDPVNMSLVMFPMIILYVISIGLAFIAEKGRHSAGA